MIHNIFSRKLSEEEKHLIRIYRKSSIEEREAIKKKMTSLITQRKPKPYSKSIQDNKKTK